MAAGRPSERTTMSEFSDKKALAAFKKAAAAYAMDATTSRTKARNTLVRLGILTKSGRISNKYR
jgi:hypothetical protein